MTGAILGSNYLWYNHVKELEEDIYNKNEVIDILDTSSKDALIQVRELKTSIEEKNEIINNMQQEIDSMPKVSSVHTMEATYYTHTGNPCANGNMPTAGYTCASNYFPLGTKLRIDGNIYAVEDTGGMCWDVIDIFVDTEHEAIQRGRHPITVEVIA